VVNGSISSDSTEISEHKIQFYTHLYSKQFNWQPKLDGLTFNHIDEEVIWLERAFQESKHFEVVKAINGDKALGMMVFLWLSSNLVGGFLNKMS
jgi:hypothetical protein